MEVGKERGYVLYDEVSDVLPTDLNGTADLDDVLAGFDGAGIEILEDPKPEFDKELKEGDEPLDLELPPGVGERPTIRCACTCARWARSPCSPARVKSK